MLHNSQVVVRVVPDPDILAQAGRCVKIHEERTGKSVLRVFFYSIIPKVGGWTFQSIRFSHSPGIRDDPVYNSGILFFSMILFIPFFLKPLKRLVTCRIPQIPSLKRGVNEKLPLIESLNMGGADIFPLLPRPSPSPILQ